MGRATWARAGPELVVQQRAVRSRDEPQDSFVRNAMLDELHQPGLIELGNDSITYYPLRDLAAALRDHAKGVFSAEAAVELLIRHRGWLMRRDFVGEYVEEFESETDRSSMALVDWSAAVVALESGRLPCSSSEGQVLRLAASIAEGLPADLPDAVCGLDAANAVLVARALVHAAGHRRADLGGGEDRR